MDGAEGQVQVRVEITDERGTRTCHDDFHGQGDTVKVEAVGYGPQAVFRIFMNDKLKTRMTKLANDARPEP